jgi:ribosomal protein S18 acetylase RimI-like enzyme
VFTLRTATPEDLPTVLGFWQKSAENANRPADSDAALKSLLARDPDALILATEKMVDGVVAGERIVGTVIAGFDGWRCHLYRLAVDPERRRQGIGSALIAHAESRFRELGGGRSDAMVLNENVSAQSAWWAGGYRVQEDWSRWVKPL